METESDWEKLINIALSDAMKEKMVESKVRDDWRETNYWCGVGLSAFMANIRNCGAISKINGYTLIHLVLQY